MNVEKAGFPKSAWQQVADVLAGRSGAINFAGLMQVFQRLDAAGILGLDPEALCRLGLRPQPALIPVPVQPVLIPQ